ncbi:MAG TPA: putative sulfate exporter family transporter [Gaiellaceae bacterium]|nr:putative sulfate exporter family transporter [Gaiellaceae bacterium]
MRRRPEAGAIAGAAVLAATVAVARPLGDLASFVGAPALALVLGMVVRLRWRPAASARPVLRFASKTVLQAAIVLLGATFGLGDVLRIGRDSLPSMLGTLALALLAAYVVGRALRVDGRLQTLVGVGTAICGASAIGAVSGIVAATESEIAYAISTIFVFNVVAVVAYPPLGHLLGLSQHAFGIWSGTAVNDTSSVVAAASAYGHTAAGVAVVTKLARTTMIVPIAVGLAAFHGRRAGSAGAERKPLWKLVPAFLVWFLLAAAIHSTGVVHARASHDLAWTATLLITIALAAIGLSTNVTELKRAGVRPLLLGTVLWAVVGISGLLLQSL